MRTRAPIDDALVRHLRPAAGDVVLELGCGHGYALLAAADAAPDLRLVGVDLDADVLRGAATLLAGGDGRHLLVQADLGHPFPFATGSVARVLCHNVLELLAEPAALVAEAARVLRPGGRSVWSSTDFESVAIGGGDVELTRRVVAAYAETPDPGFVHCDGQMGRKLPALLAGSSLERTAVDAHVVLRTELRGLAEVRVKSMLATLRDAGHAGLSPDELQRWMDGLVVADRAGEFVYAHTTYIVVARKRC